jgi:hypothetical protein
MESVIENFEEWAHLRRRHAATENPASPATISTEAAPQEASMTVLAEAKTIFHDGLAKLEELDEGAIGVLSAVQVNPTAVSITNTLASVAHLPDPQGLLANVDAILKTLAGTLAAGVRDTAPAAPAEQPSFTPAGPSVAGQA